MARNDTLRTRAASGNTLAGTTTGLGGASLDWDRRERVTPAEQRMIFETRLGMKEARGPSLPGWSEHIGSNVLPSRRKPCLELSQWRSVA